MQRKLIAAMSVGLATILPTQAVAIIPFYNEFRATYVKENKDKEFVKVVTDAKCFICHVGKDRKNRNAYGQRLAELLDKTKDKANKKKMREAFEKVAAMHTDPEDKMSPTFGDLIREGKLPGGEVQKEDPK